MAFGHNVQFVALAPETLLALDPDKIRSVLRNLLDNALKYSPEKSPIVVQLMRGPEQVVLSVKDSGRGIPTDELERVFEPFYRVDKSRTRATGGFGLGLSFCRRVVQAHSGTIAVESSEGKGTKVIVTLPAAS